MLPLGSEEASAVPDQALAEGPTDRSLLRRFQGGNEDAAALLYSRYWKRLWALARKKCSPTLARCLEADDIVQSVFRRFFHHARSGFYDVPDGEELWGLLLVITLNKIRAEEAYYRAAKRDVRATVGSDCLDQYCESAEHDAAAEALLQMGIDEALQCLSPRDRRVVELRIEGYKVAEIADQTRRSKRTVERVLQEAQKKLSVLFQGNP